MKRREKYAIPVFPCEDDDKRGVLALGSAALDARARGQTSALGKFPGWVDRRVLKPSVASSGGSVRRQPIADARHRRDEAA